MLTIDGLKTALQAAAGDDEVSVLEGDILDVAFGDLGYDSLAIMETTNHIERQFGVSLPEDEVGQVQTPRELLELVNRHAGSATPVN
jgi:act minimal PKS acyl carrier protein